MSSIPFVLILGLLFSSCGGFRLFENKSVKTQREVASIIMQELVHEEAQTFIQEIDERLLALHSYQVMAWSNLEAFDESIESSSLTSLYQSSPYLNLLAIHSQVDEIENELDALWIQLNSQKKKSSYHKKELFLNRVQEFSKKSNAQARTLLNLSRKLKLESPATSEVTSKEIQDEYKRLEISKEFQIFEKNIEHLSHLMSSSGRDKEKRFFPSTGPHGVMSGKEYPPKVWSLSFNDGPHSEITHKILHHLKENGLKASFYPLSQNVKKNKELAKKIVNLGMDIGSHTESHKMLTTVGSLTLDREITKATETLENELQISVKHMRLPYGVGATVPHIRQKIADNKLIVVQYTIDTLDWVTQTSEKIVIRTRALMKKTPHDSGIILFHDTSESTVHASLEIMKDLKLQGRRTCAINEVISEMNEGVETVCSKL